MDAMELSERKLTLVVAGSGRQARNYAETAQLPRAGSRLVFDDLDLQGIDPAKVDVRLVGDYWNNPAYDAMTEAVEAGRLPLPTVAEDWQR